MKKKEVVLQEEISDCGVCSLLSIIRHYNGNVSLEKLRYLTNTTQAGVTAYNLIECAKKIGFDCKAYKNQDIKTISMPFIAHLKLDNGLYHFVVVYDITDLYVNIMDPSCGFKKIQLNEFLKIYNNIAITLYPRTSLVNIEQEKSIYNEITTSIKKNYKSYINIIILNVIFVFLSILYSVFVDILNTYSNFNYLYIISLFLTIITLKNYFNYLVSLNIEKLKHTISLDVITSFLNHIFKLPLKYLHMKDSKEIIKRVEELDGLKEYYSSLLINIIIDILIIIPILIILLFISKITVLIYFIYLIICIVFTNIYINVSKYHYILEDLIVNKTIYSSKLIDYVGGLISLRHSRLTNVTNNVISPFKESEQSQIKYNKTISKLELVLNVFKESVLILIFAYLYVKSKNTFAITVYFLLNIILDTSFDFFNLIPNNIFIKKYIEKINDFYNLDSEELKLSKNINKDITISNLNFSYVGYDLVLNNINAFIKSGEHILLKGKSGCGKSTLCKILNQDYDYTGSIKIGQKELSKMSVNPITFASQNEHIFSDTIKNNILLGRNIDDKELNSIIDICQIDEIIKNRHGGIDHFIFSEDELSGGEKQRVILARTLVNSTDIIILDETLSETNTKLETKIITNLLKQYKQKTIIYVTHKSCVDEFFDRIVYV